METWLNDFMPALMFVGFMFVGSIKILRSK